MIQEALGLIEVIGFVPALEAADACVKSANVKFIGYEKVTGGLVTVKIQGDVGAVKAAIEAGRSSAERIGTVISTLVIPRPALGIQSFIHLSEDVLSEQPEEQTSGTIESPEQLFSLKEVAVSHEETAIIEDSLQNNQDGAEEIVNDEVPAPESDLSQTAGSEDGDEPVHTKGKEEKKVTCNLCGDPKCSREKGMPRNLCIHYKENN